MEDKRIKELEEENKRLKATIRELRDKVDRYQRSINKRSRDDYEYVDFGRDG